MRRKIQTLSVIILTTLSFLRFSLNVVAQADRTAFGPATFKSTPPKALIEKEGAWTSTAALPRSIPESEGISSSGIVDFLKAADTTTGVEIHSFMIVRNGKVVSEGWWNPYGPDYKHIMYSTSKTFTATAIGLAVAEKRLKISDKVLSFFPNSLPEQISDRMKALKVKDLLTMSVGQEPGPRISGNDDWIRTFLSIEPVHDPGTTFLYNNMATFMLSAILQQVTGQTVFDYLSPRIFQPLGLRGIDWDMNPQGINLGMTGLRLRTEDMAKFGLLLLQGGNWNGKSLIPSAWVKEATSFHIESNDPGNKRPKQLNDWMQGYCYQMWRGRYNSVRFDGARGQFGILIPDKNAVVILTSGSANTQKEMDLVWEHLLPAMKDSRPLLKDDNLAKNLNERLALLKCPTSETKIASTFLESAISGKEFQIDSNKSNIRTISFNFSNDGICKLTMKQGESVNSITVRANAWALSNSRTSNLFPMVSTLAANIKSTDAHYRLINPLYKVAASYAWIDSNTLQLSTRFVEESVGEDTFLLKFLESNGQVQLSIEQKRSGSSPAFAIQPVVHLTGKTVSSR